MKKRHKAVQEKIRLNFQPNVEVRQIHTGSFAMFIQNEYGEEIDIFDEFLIPHPITKEQAWESGYRLVKLSANINRTHPFIKQFELGKNKSVAKKHTKKIANNERNHGRRI